MDPQHIHHFCLEIGRALIDLGLPVKVLAYMSPSGMYWRCQISYQAHHLHYSDSTGWDIFNLGDCSTMTPKQAAARLLAEQLGAPVPSERPLWTGAIEDAETTLWIDWYCRMVDLLGPKGFWSEFSDYGGFSLIDPEQQLANVQWPKWEEVQALWRSSRTPHPFLLYSERHALADLAKNGNWAAVKEVIEAHPSWVNLPRPVVGKASSGYTPLHQAAYFGTIEATKMLLALGADLDRASRDGAALQIARSRGHTALVQFLASQLEGSN